MAPTMTAPPSPPAPAPAAAPAPGPSLDALVPREMARKAEDVGVTKAGLALVPMFTLAVLAGAFIAFGAIFSTIASAGAPGTALPFGVTRILSGLVFSVGLILVVIGGAELFTGNNLIVMAWASGRVPTARLLRNWAVVYVGNLVGAVAVAAAAFAGNLHLQGGGAVGRRALDIAATKTALGVWPAFVLGILANVLVCLAVWLCMGARTVTDKVLAIVFPISTFVAAGFEHSIANMYFLPFALFVKGGAADAFWAKAATTSGAYPTVTWGDTITGNLLPVTLGNVVGGAVLVGLVYWSVYLRADGRGRARRAERGRGATQG